tara:strand:+ start:1821 stop:1958 length:138 start_codon:yes stop_codon:yes gene_type:complete
MITERKDTVAIISMARKRFLFLMISESLLPALSGNGLARSQSEGV